MSKYLVGVKIYNCFEVEADSPELVEEAVRDMDNDEILFDSDFNVTYIDEGDV